MPEIIRSARLPYPAEKSAVMIDGFMPLPDIVKKASAFDPSLKPLFLEMAALDPTTFLHQVMVAECYILLRQEYINSIKPSNPPSVVKRLDEFLKSYDVPSLFHDIGKWLIRSSPHEATAIVNSKPPAEGINSSQPFSDHRSTDEIRRHMLHPLTGALTIPYLAELLGSLPKSLLMKIAEASIAHHEHFSPNEVIDHDGRTIYSYPRNRLRLESNTQKIFHAY